MSLLQAPEGWGPGRFEETTSRFSGFQLCFFPNLAVLGIVSAQRVSFPSSLIITLSTHRETPRYRNFTRHHKIKQEEQHLWLYLAILEVQFKQVKKVVMEVPSTLGG